MIRYKKGKIKTCFHLTLLFIFLLVGGVGAMESSPQEAETVIFTIGQKNYQKGDELIEIDVAPYIKSGRMMVPIAFAAPALGTEPVQWLPKDKMVLIKKGEDRIGIFIDSKELLANGKKVSMDIPPEIVDIGNGGGRTMVPISSIASAMDIGYQWLADHNSVYFYGKQDVYDQPGTFGHASALKSIEGNVIVLADGVILQNLLIKGNLIIGEEVGDGDVTLNNITVNGDTHIRGGGPDSIYINGGNYNNLTIEKPNAHIVTMGNTLIHNLEIKEQAPKGILELNDETVIKNIVIESEVAIKGRSIIERADIKANGITFETAPKEQIVLSTLTTPPVIISSQRQSSSSGDNESSVAPEPIEPTEPAEPTEPTEPAESPETPEPEDPEPEVPQPPEIVQSGFIAGLVTNAKDSKGIPSVAVAVYQPDRVTPVSNSLVLTNNKGEYFIENIKPGTGYTVKFTKEGYKSGEEGDIEVANNEITIVNKAIIPLSSEKKITSFKFEDLLPEAVGEIDAEAQTINLVVPYGTDITKLVPTIDYTGVNLVPDSGEGQDYTHPITYTVTAEDDTIAQYLVIVTVAEPLCTGDKVYHSVEGVTFAMILAPQATFVTGVDGIGATAKVEENFWTAETEVTYQLWHKVYTWALENGYIFYNAGTQGNNGGAGVVPNERKYEPVTSINWYDAIVWSNALTEYYNQIYGPIFEIVYKDQHNEILKDASVAETIEVQVNLKADGFRLPTKDEWELAARWKGNNLWTPGNYASGATASWSNINATSAVAWYNASKTQDVGQKLPNDLGIYDMSGNVWEWTSTTFTDQAKKVIRGGAYNNSTAKNLQTGEVFELQLESSSHNLGFRLVRTAGS